MKPLHKSLFLILLIFSSFFVRAQQMAGGEISYTCTGNNNYTVKVVLYAKCPTASLPSSVSLSVFSPSSGVAPFSRPLSRTGSDETIKACPGNASACEGGTGESAEAITKRTYSGTVTLSSAQTDWRFSIQEGIRPSLSTADPASDKTPMSLVAEVNNKNGCNSSATFDNNPLFFSSSKLPVSHDPGIKNPDNDQQSISLIKPLRSPQTSLEYKSGYSATSPLTGSFSISPATGKFNFTPTVPQENTAIAIKITENKNGTFAGSVMREMYFQTLSEQSSPPVFTSPAGDTIKICQGGSLSAVITGSTGTGTAADMIFNNATQWPGSTPSISRSGNNVTFRLNFSTSFTEARPINITLHDSKCGLITKTFYVKINPRPTITNPVKADSSVLCLKEFKITANVTGGKQPYKYVWNTGDTTKTVTVKSATNHTVTVTDANGCSSAPWTKRLSSPIDFEMGRKLTSTTRLTCVDSLLSFYDISAAPANRQDNVAYPLSKTRKWRWDFGDGMIDSTSGKVARHKFPSDTTFDVKLTIFDSTGCSNTKTKKFQVHGKPTASFTKIDSCVRTENSDLILRDETTSEDIAIKRENKKYYLDGVFKTIPNQFNEVPYFIQDTGTYTVKVVATNDAGCVDTLSKKILVRPRPLITSSPRAYYFYRCDLAGFPDTTFQFSGKPVGEAVGKGFSANVKGYKMQPYAFLYKPDTLVKVQYKIWENPPKDSVNFVTFQVVDVFGCTNDTSVSMLDPVTPDITLTKYYCFLNDTLKLTDESYPFAYHWGADSSVWDMKDGTKELTHGVANHAYTTLDEAVVKLTVTDSKSCKDSDSIKVFLSEPDTSQFRIIDPLACFADTVKIIGIKNKYINSWYYRFYDTLGSIYDNPDVPPLINNTFGKAVPAGVDNIRIYNNSKNYTASTSIFYNDSTTANNFVRRATFPNDVLVPRNPAKVCHLEVRRDWKIVDRLRFTINDTYDRCYDSLKVFDAKLSDSLYQTLTIDTTSWKWTLLSPTGTTLNEQNLDNNSQGKYRPATSLFSQIATLRNNYPANPPYTIKSGYTYQYKSGQDSITCSESAELKVANEKITLDLDPGEVTCSNYFNDIYYNSLNFVETLRFPDNTEFDEKKSFKWQYADSVYTEYPFSQKFTEPSVYKLIASVRNYYGCEGTDSMMVTVKPSPSAALRTDTVCEGLANTIDATESQAALNSKIKAYYWFNQSPIPLKGSIPDTSAAYKISAENLYTEIFKVGEYPVGVVVLDTNKCLSVSEIKTVKVTPVPEADYIAVAKATQDQDYVGNEAIDFIPLVQNADLLRWNFGDGNIVTDTTSATLTKTYPYYAPPNPKEKNIYDVSLFVKTDAGCVDSITKKIDVNVYFELPTAFSPNDDGLHDKLIGVGKGIKQIKEFKIFNRWGEMIHSISGIPEKDTQKRGYLLWDGTYNGQVQPVGSYVYYAVVTTGYGNDLIKKGNLTLLR